MEKKKTEPGMSLQVLNFEGSHFRVRMINNEPCFVAKDLCQILGISKYRDVLRHLDDDERVSMFVDTIGGNQRLSGVNESGFYHLIFLSRSPKAREFRRMVTMDILPTLRKTGRYEFKSRRRALPYEKSVEMCRFFLMS
ncbi:Bro-N domain-containing protein [Prevotella sp. OH937_COT-195]|uniref:BRO-N domain-containing protein n=1 Tax=Prevotella sp. OH937_COT-195 TaxID=2491051 RepID=UPI000F64B766|nr:BRO family protein [Prevotella sp. OH937_COT-195]RRC96633.1 hypothetical protein EII32_11205 [Prevotella sp. OH937_COT-195]